MKSTTNLIRKPRNESNYKNDDSRLVGRGFAQQLFELEESKKNLYE